MPVGNAASWGLDSSSVGQSLVDPGGGAATWGLLGAEQPYAGSDQIADAGNMWQGGNFAQYWDPRLDPGQIELHSHTCPSCAASWAHGDCSFGDDGAHTCPSCGTVQWRKNMVGMVGGDETLPDFAERVITWEQIEAFNAQVVHLEADINKWIQLPAQDTPKAALWKFDKWDSWRIPFAGWRASVQARDMTPGSALGIPLPTGAYGNGHAAEFDDFQSQFNEALRSFKEMGGFTTVGPAQEPKSKLGEWLASLPWMWIGLAALTLGFLYLGGPALIAGIAARSRA